MKTYWYGYGGHSHHAEKLRSMIERIGCTLTTIHEHENADIKWNRHTVLNELKNADVIILPCDFRNQDAKSANKLVQALSLGKPVVCSPLPAYLEVLKDYPSVAFVAGDDEDWERTLTILRNDIEVRKNMSINAPDAIKQYSIDEIGKKWLSQIFDTEKTDIIIPTYNNLKCLKMTLDSIKRCTSVLYNIIVVDASTNNETFDYLQTRADIRVVRSQTPFAATVNKGLEISTSKYICILNDDVIVSNDWLKYMIETCNGIKGIVGVLSNCDFGWVHAHEISINGIDLLPGVNTILQIAPNVEDIYSYRSKFNEVIDCSWVAFYCTLFSRELFKAVGYLDEQFCNSGEDVDYCLRAKKLGFNVVQDYRSFVFHFGATSRKIAETENKDKYQSEQKETTCYLQQKYDKETVMIYSGPMWQKWSFKSLDTGIGGSEIWQICLSRELANLGYRVICFADTREKQMNDGNIVWLSYLEYEKWVEQNYVDYAILSRTTDPLRFNLRANKVYVQIHDIWMLSGKDQLFLDKVDKYCALSEWHLDFAAKYHNIPKEKMVITSNGINFDRFDKIDVERHPYRFHWSSSWDRGLDNVLYLWPFIKAELPEAELHCFYGVFNWKSSCEQRGDREGLKKIAELEELVKQPGVFVHGMVSQQQLAEEMKKASLSLYPSWFSETFFITGIECQYAGVPVICNRYAGVISTLSDSAIMLGDGNAWWPYTEEGRKQFAVEAISILKDRDKWKYWSELGRENALRYSWKNSAIFWSNLFKS